LSNFKVCAVKNVLAHPWAISLRRAVRDVAPIRGLYRWWMARHDYEEAFSQQLLSAITPQSVVWDVGANVGHYTREALAAGARKVVCLEPAPDSLEALHAIADAAPGRVVVLPVALSDTRGTSEFRAEKASVTNSLLQPGAASSDAVVDVRVERGEDLLDEPDVEPPTIIKIDVEGHEVEVIRGLGSILDSPALHDVMVEIHFRALDLRGLPDGPGEICRTLERAGFAVRWLDLSHIGASRA